MNLALAQDHIFKATGNYSYSRISILIPPTGLYCREDRCQSFFHFQLVPSVRPPLEECEAAGALRELKVATQVLDAPTLKLTESETLRRIELFNPDLVVIVATFGTLSDDLTWPKKVRQLLTNIKVGLRGAPAYTMADEILSDCPDLDFCMRGEYELVFATLAKHGISKTPGLVWRNGSNVVNSGAPLYESDLDKLPFPDRSVIDQSRYKVRMFGKSQATVRVQRGCPYPCTYCLVHTVNGDKARHRSPISIVEEIKEIQNQGINNFYFRADTFSLDRDWAMDVAEELKEHCRGVKWVTTTRVERVDQELLNAFRAAGCYGLSFGVDVASSLIGDKVKKKPDLRRAMEAMRMCDQSRIVSLAYLMIGFIWETEETLAETAEFARKMRPDLLTIHFAHPYPGTKYYEDFDNSGISVSSKKAQATPASSSLSISSKQLKRSANRMLLRHYSRPAVLSSLFRKISSSFF